MILSIGNMTCVTIRHELLNNGSVTSSVAWPWQNSRFLVYCRIYCIIKTLIALFTLQSNWREFLNSLHSILIRRFWLKMYCDSFELQLNPANQQSCIDLSVKCYNFWMSPNKRYEFTQFLSRFTSNTHIWTDAAGLCFKRCLGWTNVIVMAWYLLNVSTTIVIRHNSIYALTHSMFE